MKLYSRKQKKLAFIFLVTSILFVVNELIMLCDCIAKFIRKVGKS